MGHPQILVYAKFPKGTSGKGFIGTIGCKNYIWKRRNYPGCKGSTIYSDTEPISNQSSHRRRIPEEILNQVYPGIWATDVPGKAKNAPPIEVRLKEGRQLVRVKQYPLKQEDKEGIRPEIERFLQLELLKECESDFNTPVLSVHKSDGSYRVFQDLRAIKKITFTQYRIGSRIKLLYCFRF